MKYINIILNLIIIYMIYATICWNKHNEKMLCQIGNKIEAFSCLN